MLRLLAYAGALPTPGPAPLPHVLETQLPLERTTCFMLGMVLGILLCLWMKK